MNRYVPLPNSGFNTYQAVANQSEKGIQSTFRLDQHISDHHQLSFYYYFDNDTQLQPFASFQAAGANVPGFGANFGTRNQQFNLSETWTATPTVVNEARFTYFREGQLNYNHPQNAQLVQNVCGSAVPARQLLLRPLQSAVRNHAEPGRDPRRRAVHQRLRRVYDRQQLRGRTAADRQQLPMVRQPEQGMPARTALSSAWTCAACASTRRFTTT